MLEKMKPIIAEQLNVNEAEIKPETKFKDDLGADSLDLFEMVMALEEEFGIEIPSEDLEKIVTVNDIIGYLKEKRCGSLRPFTDIQREAGNNENENYGFAWLSVS